LRGEGGRCQLPELVRKARSKGIIAGMGEERLGGRVGAENKMGWTGNRHRIVLIFSGQIMVD